jgi:hypothetical protein
MAWHISTALMTAYENSRFSQGLEGVSLAGTSSDGDASAPSNGNPTPPLYLPEDRMKAFSRLSRFGMTFRPLTEYLGADLLTWYREAFLAKTLAAPEREQASPGNAAGCGSTWRGSLARYDRATSSWRTAQYSLHGDLELFSETWPRWGTMRNGECSERDTPVGLLNGTEYGSWPAPVKTDGFAGFSTKSMERKERGEPRPSGAKIGSSLKWERRALPYVVRGRINPILHQWLMNWPYGWTSLRPQETDKFQQWCASHGIPFTNGSPPDEKG